MQFFSPGGIVGNENANGRSKSFTLRGGGTIIGAGIGAAEDGAMTECRQDEPGVKPFWGEQAMRRTRLSGGWGVLMAACGVGLAIALAGLAPGCGGKGPTEQDKTRYGVDGKPDPRSYGWFGECRYCRYDDQGCRRRPRRRGCV